MVISGTYTCSLCGTSQEFERLELPEPPYKIPCKHCGAALIQSVPEDVMEAWAKEIEANLTPEEKKLLGRE